MLKITAKDDHFYVEYRGAVVCFWVTPSTRLCAFMSTVGKMPGLTNADLGVLLRIITDPHPAVRARELGVDFYSIH